MYIIKWSRLTFACGITIVIIVESRFSVACWYHNQKPNRHVHKHIVLICKCAAAWQNQQNDLCAQWRLRSAWASAQWVAEDPKFLHADSEGSDQTGRMPRLFWVRWAQRSFCLFCREAAQMLKRARRKQVTIFTGVDNLYVTKNKTTFPNHWLQAAKFFFYSQNTEGQFTPFYKIFLTTKRQ